MKVEGGENPWLGKRQKVTEKKARKSIDDYVNGHNSKRLSEAEGLAEHILVKIMFRTRNTAKTRQQIAEVLERYAHKYANAQNKALIEKMKQLEEKSK